MLQLLNRHLYLRIWLAVVLGVAVLMALVGWAWRASVEHNAAAFPMREWVVRNAQGEVLGSTAGRLRPGQPVEIEVTLADGGRETLVLERHPERGGPPMLRHAGMPWWARPPYGFAWMLGLMGLGAALALYPVVRRLTKRLEGLQQGVQRWGEGDLSVRVPESGEDEVADLSRRFNAAAERIQNLLSSQKSLLANASHELRSPLTVIAGYLETLALDGDLPADLRMPILEMRRQSERMTAIVADLLELSRLEANDEQVIGQPIDVAALLAVLRKDLVTRDGARHSVTVSIDSPDGLMGDPGLIHSAFWNLVDNAAKYTPEGGSIALRWWTDGDGGHFSVTDSGPGIAAEHLPRLTERFYRVDPGRARDAGGSGLGLAIVRHVLQRHGGELKIDSIEGRGSTFSCHFPHLRLVIEPVALAADTRYSPAQDA